ncbi:MAG: glycosyltransferase family 2 protein [Thermodesulfobacteria bacterium]|nr:glycosyltransferase family 2 protein [Thermodesulfobacteriota bacterium]
MLNKRVGILLATYNGEKYISDQVNSILNQTYKNWTLLIHDDGSKDGTIEIIKEFVKKYPEKIILWEDGKTLGGSKENFAHLLNIAKKEFDFDYVMFCDQDDVWLPKKIEITLKKFVEIEKRSQKETPIIVHTDLKVVDEDLNIIADSFWCYQKINPFNVKLSCLILENVVTGCAMMMNKALIDKVHFIPKDALVHDWWITLVCAALGGEIFPIFEPLVLYRQHGTNSIGAKDFTILGVLKRFRRNPYQTFKNALEKSKRIKKQNIALANYLESELNVKNELLLKYKKSCNNPLKRKIFYMKNKCLCGYPLKKFLKLIFC